MVSKITYSDGTSLSYEYYKSGNIIEIYTNGVLIQQYKYEGIGRHVRDDNSETELTMLYEYDASGNILIKNEYTVSFDGLGTLLNNQIYTYDSSWKDQLKTYSGSAAQLFMMQRGILFPVIMATVWYGKKDVKYKN